MKCYRVYVKNECVGCFFNMGQAVEHMGMFFAAGYESDDCEIKIEKY